MITKISRDNAISWAAMPQVLERISNFCLEHRSDIPGPQLVDMVSKCFGTGDPSVGVWINLNDKGVVDGHLLALIQDAIDGRLAIILQADTDKGNGHATRSVFNEVMAWAKSQGANKLQILTRRGPSAFIRRWGFAEKYHLMERDLE